MATRPSTPLGVAFAWAGRIMAIGLVMVLPGVGGRWLDDRFETTWWEPAGFAFGFAAGLLSLIRIAGTASRRSPRPPGQP